MVSLYFATSLIRLGFSTSFSTSASLFLKLSNRSFIKIPCIKGKSIAVFKENVYRDYKIIFC